MINKAFLSILIFLIVVLFTACSTIKQQDILKEDLLYEKALTYTKKGEIVNSLETKAVIFATYLNELDAKYKSDENASFLIGIYIADDFKNDERKAFKNSNFLLTHQNGSKPIFVKQLYKDSQILKTIPLVNRWATYYLMTFKDNNKNHINLIYSSKDYGKTTLNFIK